MKHQNIIDKLPYSKPFLFVDEILEVTLTGITGNYTYDISLDFYKGHFTKMPITPGVILTETMAQIGLVALGIYLLGDKLTDDTRIAMTSVEIEFLKPVYPGEKITVTAEKVYFRFGKLKCSVRMTNAEGQEVCSGLIAGIIIE